jgi:hypothetical protein
MRFISSLGHSLFLSTLGSNEDNSRRYSYIMVTNNSKTNNLGGISLYTEGKHTHLEQQQHQYCGCADAAQTPAPLSSPSPSHYFRHPAEENQNRGGGARTVCDHRSANPLLCCYFEVRYY